MKISVFLFIALLGCSLINKAQDLQGECYWVIESNRNIPNSSVVKIYNQDNELLHEIKLDTRLDINKRKHRKALAKMTRRYFNHAADNARVRYKKPVRSNNVKV